jgi:hypothetical protein
VTASVGCGDQKKPASFVCRPKAGQCDVEETCTGTANTCPADGFVAAGTACDDGNACTVDDACNGSGSCIGQSCLDDGNPCTTDSCDTVAGCLHVPVPDGMVCDDDDPCTSMDACTGGVCGGVLTAADSDGDGYCDFQENQAGCASDDASEIPPQSVSFGGRPAGRADVLLTYATPSQRDVLRASDRSCATVGHCGRFGTCNLTTQKCEENSAIACTSDASCVFGPRGFCTAGKIQDPCVANTDCDQPADTCRVVVNFAADGTLALGSATLNRRDNPAPGFTPVGPGCSRKVDVALDSEPAR